MRQTTLLKPQEVSKAWFVIDANGQTLGHIAAHVANVLRGKNKATFTPNVDMGDNVIVINASKVLLSANKEEGKIYYRHTGYPGGLRSRTAAQQRKHKPSSLVELAVKGMVPHTILGRAQLRHLFVYPNAEHEHAAQKPQVMELK